MSTFTVAWRYSTVLIGAMAIVAAFGLSGRAVADITADTASSDGTAPLGSYTSEDSASLMGVLDAPARSSAADATFENEPDVTNSDITSLRTAPATINQFTLDPESKKFEAWDLKGGSIVPEPATALLMGAGLAALAVLRGLRGKARTE